VAKSGEKEEWDFLPEEGEVRIGGNQGGVLEECEGGGEAVGVGKFVFAFQFGREAGLFHADGNDIYWQLGNLFDHVPGDSRAAGAPDGIVSFSPVYDAHCEAGFSGTGLLKQSDQLFGAGAILVNGDDRAAPSTKRFNNRAPRGAFRLGKSIAPTSHF
jgi:hypothetical protein